jgi:hypothetical protein
MALVVTLAGILSGILAAICAMNAGAGALGAAVAYPLGGVAGVVVLLSLNLLRQARAPLRATAPRRHPMNSSGSARPKRKA